MKTRTSYVVYGGTPNPPSKELITIDGSFPNAGGLTDYFPEKEEDKNNIREIADWLKVIVKEKKSGDLIDCIIFKPENNSGTKFFLIGFSKSRPEGARGPIGKFDTPEQCSGKFTSFQDAQQALRFWVDNPVSGVEYVDNERKYRKWTR
ncbi:hypothetical protein [Rhizobium sp. ZPR3]|uniref:Uncharacterized protein n=2 Tax=unclassified Rhizobium TaxID=2613769 RepID=A0AAU7SC93_9HYPH